MEPIYIVAICAGGVFFAVFLLFVIITSRRSKREEMLQNHLDEVYADKNIAKMEYDFAVYDEETSRMLSQNAEDEQQVTIYDVLKDGATGDADGLFGKIDSEGMEEITGNYKPE